MLNVAEIELSVVGRRLHDRFDNVEDLQSSWGPSNRSQTTTPKAWTGSSNVEKARIKLKRLYPSFECGRLTRA